MMNFKKHHYDFSSKEKEILYQRLNDGIYRFTKYTVFRSKQRVVTMDEVFRALKDCKIIEFHRKDGENRILIRGNVNEKGYNICLVLNIDTKEMITVYSNEINDNHEGLHKEEYIAGYFSIMNYIKPKNKVA